MLRFLPDLQVTPESAVSFTDPIFLPFIEVGGGNPSDLRVLGVVPGDISLRAHLKKETPLSRGSFQSIRNGAEKSFLVVVKINPDNTFTAEISEMTLFSGCIFGFLRIWLLDNIGSNLSLLNNRCLAGRCHR